jgi:hypothetical protein
MSPEMRKQCEDPEENEGIYWSVNQLGSWTRAVEGISLCASFFSIENHPSICRMKKRAVRLNCPSQKW